MVGYLQSVITLLNAADECDRTLNESTRIEDLVTRTENLMSDVSARGRKEQMDREEPDERPTPQEVRDNAVASMSILWGVDYDG